MQGLQSGGSYLGQGCSDGWTVIKGKQKQNIEEVIINKYKIEASILDQVRLLCLWMLTWCDSS